MQMRPKLTHKQYDEAMNIELLMSEGPEKDKAKRRWRRRYHKSWPFLTEMRRNELVDTNIQSDARWEDVVENSRKASAKPPY